MEQLPAIQLMQNNNNKYNLETIIIGLINGYKIETLAKELTFKKFLNLIILESDYSVYWKHLNFQDKNLYLFSNEWNIPNKLPHGYNCVQNYITKYFNSLIIDSDFNIIMYGGPKVYDSNRDKISLNKISNFINHSKLINSINLDNVDNVENLDNLDNLDNVENLDNSEISENVENSENSDNTSLITIYKAYEGTSINVFYYCQKWWFTTKKKFDMFDSKFGSKRTHGHLFEDIIEIDNLIPNLNLNYTYHFILIHPENTHLTTITKPILILTTIRDINNLLNINSNELLYNPIFFITKQINEIDEFIITRPIIFTNNDNTLLLSNNDNIDIFNLNLNLNLESEIDSQGVIIHYGEFIFRVYNNNYSKNLISKPYFNTKYEDYLHKYQNNKFKGSVNNQDNLIQITLYEKKITIAAFNYIAIILHRILIHFTKFSKYFTKAEIKQYPNYKFIQKIYLIQDLTKPESEWDNEWKYVCGNDNCTHIDSAHSILIKNLYKLQHLPYAIKHLTEVDFNQVKYHLKNHCSAKELYALYCIFTSHSSISDLCDIVGYKTNNKIAKYITDFALI